MMVLLGLYKRTQLVHHLETAHDGLLRLLLFQLEQLLLKVCEFSLIELLTQLGFSLHLFKLLCK